MHGSAICGGITSHTFDSETSSCQWCNGGKTEPVTLRAVGQIVGYVGKDARKEALS